MRASSAVLMLVVLAMITAVTPSASGQAASPSARSGRETHHGRAMTSTATTSAVASRSRAGGGAPTLVFEGVTVVDVEQGRLQPNQRVIVAGTRIQSISEVGTTPLPRGARVVSAAGKYLIPGLWDLHMHIGEYPDVFHPLLLANGVTGIRDAASSVSLPTQRHWRDEVLAGRRVGPPRQILSGPAIDNGIGCGSGPQGASPSLRQKPVHPVAPPPGDTAKRQAWLLAAAVSNHDYIPRYYHHCLAPTAAATRQLVDSLKADGVDMLKTYFLSDSGYFFLAAEARRAGLPFGGHYGAVSTGMLLTAAADSGASILDHELPNVCQPADPAASFAACRAVAEHFRRTGTWVVLTSVNTWVNSWNVPEGRITPIKTRHPELFARYRELVRKRLRGFWLEPWGPARFFPQTTSDSVNDTTATPLALAQEAGLPIAAGTDDLSLLAPLVAPGFTLHLELAMNVAGGLTPLNALQTATLNPAKMLHATDSLGTVAPGKLADLVLLDGDPLTDITNTAAIRAVVANGRYFDRAALDRVLADTRVTAKRLYPFWLPRP